MDSSIPSTLSVEAFTVASAKGQTDTRHVAVQPNPDRIAANGDAIWITGQDRLVRLDIEGRAIWTFQLGRADGALIGGGSDVTIGEGAVWVTCSCSSEPDPRFGATTGGVVKIDAQRNKVAAVRIFDDRTPGRVIASNGSVWITTGGGITRLSVKDLTTEAEIQLQTDYLAAGNGRVWAITGDEAIAYLAQIDPASDRVVSKWRLPASPSGVVEAFGSLWMTTGGGAQLLRIDPHTGASIGRAINLFTSADGLAVGSGSLWVMSTGERTVKRIDPSSAQIVASYDLTSEPAYIAAAKGTAWVTSYRDSIVTRLSI